MSAVHTFPQGLQSHMEFEVGWPALHWSGDLCHAMRCVYAEASYVVMSEMCGVLEVLPRDRHMWLRFSLLRTTL